MTTNETSGQESDGRTDIEITVCETGVVNVHRPESERAHSVILGVLGDVVHCSCKGYKFRGECSHADAIESRPLVVSSALAAAADTQRIATDGGEQLAESDDRHECLHCDRVFDDLLVMSRHARLTCPENPNADDQDETDDDGGDGRGVVDVHGCSTCGGYAYGDADQCPECQQRGVSPVNEAPL